MQDTYPLKWITQMLAVGYAPRSEDQLQAIHDGGIQAIVNLCAECYDLHEAEKKSLFDVYYLPVEDEGAPTVKELEDLISWMKLQIESGKKLLVHCRYGIGRTGTIVLAFLIASGYSFKEAQKLMSPTPAWPSNRTQKELVDHYITLSQHFSIKNNFSNKETNSLSTYFEKWKKVLQWDD